MSRLLHICFYSLISGLVLFSSCKEDVDEPLTESEVNAWIYNEMQNWYLWTDELPASPSYSLESGLFYQTLLVSQDRFSFYYEDYQTLINLLNGVSLDPGFEFRLFRDKDNEGNVLGIVLYVKPESPGAKVGMKRGDLFSKINGVTLTEANYRTLLDEMQTTFDLTFSRYNFNSESFQSAQVKTLSPIEFAENPFLLDTVYQIGGKKIGYLIYNFFSSGPRKNQQNTKT